MALALESDRLWGGASAITALLRHTRTPLTEDDRRLLADFIEGKVRRPRGHPPLAHKVAETKKNLSYILAEDEVRRRKDYARANGQQLKHEDVIADVAELCRVDPNRLANRFRRPKKNTPKS